MVGPFTLALPLVALLATSAVLGPEVDDGSIVYLLAKPVNRYGLAISKYVRPGQPPWCSLRCRCSSPR